MLFRHLFFTSHLITSVYSIKLLQAIITIKITMTPEGKIWIILKTIDEMLAIAPSDRPVLVDTRELEKSVSREDNDQIFEKLAKDYRLIEILKKPDYQTGFNYSVKILNLDESFANFSKIWSLS